MISENQLYSMNTHYRYYDLDYFLKSSKENNINNIELWLCPQHFYINSFFYEDSKNLVSKLKKYNIKIKCICPEQNNPKPNNIAAREKDLIQYTFNYFKKVIDLAVEVKSELVLITPGWNYYDEDPAEARQRSITMIKRLCEYAYENNITLALESIWNKSSLIGDTIDKIHEIKEGVNQPNLKLALDLGALSSASETVQDWFDVFGEDIIHCHFVDGDPTGHLPWGEGELNMMEILQQFSDNKYSGGFSMEFIDSRSYKNPEKWDEKAKKIFVKNINLIEGGN